VSVDHLYVHVPFCARKCPYCDFNSHAGRDGETRAYVDALVAEAVACARGLAPRTVFVGGGTPTHPDAASIDRMLDGVLSQIDRSRLAEVTVEANPGTLTADKVRVLLRNGVDRVSVGVQSFDDARLKVLGRIHDAADAARAVATLRDAGVPRVSLDLILATPGQSLDEQRRDLDRAVALEPDHVSTYVLTFEEGTAYTKALAAGRLPRPQDDRDLAHLALACESLAAAGYRRYEVSNHAWPGEESLHNLGYWRNRDWLGLGAGAHSHVDGRRWKNVDDPAAYASRVATSGEAVEWEERVDAPTALFESLMMGLRLAVEGVDLDELASRHGVDPRVEHADAIRRHVAAGFLERTGDRLRCTPRGLDVLNTLLLDFLPDLDSSPTVPGTIGLQ
jgi:oxygen-independent coproporphyrinogen III oxidase